MTIDEVVSENLQEEAQEKSTLHIEDLTMTFDEVVSIALQKQAQEKCTLEIKQKLWLRVAVALNL